MWSFRRRTWITWYWCIQPDRCQMIWWFFTLFYTDLLRMSDDRLSNKATACDSMVWTILCFAHVDFMYHISRSMYWWKLVYGEASFVYRADTQVNGLGFRLRWCCLKPHGKKLVIEGCISSTSYTIHLQYRIYWMIFVSLTIHVRPTQPSLHASSLYQPCWQWSIPPLYLPIQTVSR